MIGIFRNQGKKDLHKQTIAMNFVENGISSLEREYFSTTTEEYRPCDIAIVWGSHKNVRGDSYFLKNIYDCQRRNGGKIIVLEKGFIKREDYYLVGWNHPGGCGDYKNDNMPPDRFQKLDVQVTPWKQKEDKDFYTK